MEWFLTIWIGATLPMATTSGTTTPFNMHYVGPLPYEVCAKARDALKQSQNVIQAECATRWSTNSTCSDGTASWPARGDGTCYEADKPHS